MTVLDAIGPDAPLAPMPRAPWQATVRWLQRIQWGAIVGALLTLATPLLGSRFVFAGIPLLLPTHVGVWYVGYPTFAALVAQAAGWWLLTSPPPNDRGLTRGLRLIIRAAAVLAVARAAFPWSFDHPIPPRGAWALATMDWLLVFAWALLYAYAAVLAARIRANGLAAFFRVLSALWAFLWAYTLWIGLTYLLGPTPPADGLLHPLDVQYKLPNMDYTTAFWLLLGLLGLALYIQVRLILRIRQVRQAVAELKLGE